MSVEIAWECEVCGRKDREVYNGPQDPQSILRVFNAKHQALSPECPHVFTDTDVKSPGVDKL
jgi:hypothetical protein